MRAAIERTIRVLDPGETPPKPVIYWRTRSAAERLAEMLRLPFEGNELFKGGNPPFVYAIEMRDVDGRQ